MTIHDAINVLDGTIPPPHNKMVDRDHFHIAEAWQVIKSALPADYVRRLDDANAIRAKFPVGTLVRALYEIEAGITIGTLGRVEGYAGDGRLQIFWHNAFRGEAHPDDVATANETEGGKC
jgi:hypothetical protein